MDKQSLIQECKECPLSQNSKGELCSVCITQKLMRGKWKIVIIWLLKKEKKRFSELERLIPNITQSYLTSQLRELEKSGLVTRTIYNEIPPKVEYSLSKKGIEFLDVESVMERWGKNYIKAL